MNANFGVINPKGIINMLSNANYSHTLEPMAIFAGVISSMHPAPVRAENFAF